MATDTEGMLPAPERFLRYPDGDYSAADSKPDEEYVARSDGCVVRQVYKVPANERDRLIAKRT